MYFLVLLCGFSLTVASSIDVHEKMLVEMELTGLDLQDLNDEISKSTEDALLQNNFKTKVGIFVKKCLNFAFFKRFNDLFFKDSCRRRYGRIVIKAK